MRFDRYPSRTIDRPSEPSKASLTAARKALDHRHHVAKKWRQYRAELRALHPERRFQILQIWQYGFMPGSHEYLGNLLHSDYTPSHHTMESIAAWMAGAEPLHGRAGRRPRLEAA